MFNFNLFKSAPAESDSAPENTWNSNTVAMQQPASPAAPSTNQQVVSEQPANQEGMSMQLRGGGGGGLCCGICAGLACFECCEICC
ncbi:hypothetical protein N7533_002963 [Penicillium manginii]|uniref:Cysteine-rich transmembrane CYSTM domain-containing protein n=1 Tax=Penicillium cosmopolitanum TaxID=1131564 RepID=A0A9W9W9R6_9EURO|nr:uncharacterized protein N7509_002628 [Penicillium cosmopolitanum]XP_056964749.1 uncharacterized protein N7533_002963 [Penicillium manginii]XP_057117159.1 uncharacterized protein N7481_010766 [Penicillium waksmanii]KAJ5408745.1 hypothetical protein N7509_002628 [Penicillium cosmopolitanum]KAJ5764282.1 hypothetical protein N7533_002963 [Penicillium manginii]KAJ5973556.1 hypothetical protein N7481_010766 [Penicillium waksmanii]